MDLNFLNQVKENFAQTLKQLELDEQQVFQQGKTDLVPLTGLSGDEVDQTSESQAHEFFYRLHSRNNFYRKKILVALKKIEDGTYGTCDECNQKIPVGRLLARPTANLCIQCKELQEKFEHQIISLDVYQNKTPWNSMPAPRPLISENGA